MTLPKVLALGVLVLALTTGIGAQERGASAPPISSRPTESRDLRIYIARHGETAFNAEGRVQGQLDIPLNRRGLEQAEALRATLNGVHFDAIYASPLSRNVTTAGIIAEGRPVRVLTTLMERSQGRYQGQLAASIADFARMMTNPRYDFDGGETTYQLGDRARRALTTIRRATPSGSVLIVGHFLTNQMLLRELLAISTEQAMQINQGNDELYLVELTPSRPPRSWKLVAPAKLNEL